MSGMVVPHADTYALVAGGWSLRGRPCWPCGPGPRVRPQATQKGEPGMAPGHGHPVCLRRGAIVLCVRATRASLLRAVRARGTGQLAPGGALLHIPASERAARTGPGRAARTAHRGTPQVIMYTCHTVGALLGPPPSSVSPPSAVPPTAARAARSAARPAAAAFVANRTRRIAAEQLEIDGPSRSMVKVPPWQRPSSAPGPPRGAPGGSGQPTERPATAAGARAILLQSRRFHRLLTLQVPRDSAVGLHAAARRDMRAAAHGGQVRRLYARHRLWRPHLLALPRDAPPLAAAHLVAPRAQRGLLLRERGGHYRLQTTYHLTTDYRLPTTDHRLPTTDYRLPTTDYPPPTPPPTTCHLPPTTYRLPPATCHLPLTPYHLPPTAYHLPLATYHLPPTTYRLPPTTRRWRRYRSCR